MEFEHTRNPKTAIFAEDEVDSASDQTLANESGPRTRQESIYCRQDLY